MSEVTIAWRHKGKAQACRLHKSALGVALWQKGVFENPARVLGGKKSLAGPKNRTQLAPYDYGLLLIDADTRWIASNQSYCNPHQLHRDEVKDPGMRVLIRDVAVAQGLVLHHFCDDGTKTFYHGHPVNLKHADGRCIDDDICNTEKSLQADISARGWMDVGVSERLSMVLPPSWSMQQFEDNGVGWGGLIDGMLERGFALPSQTVSIWSGFFNQRRMDPLLALRFEANNRLKALEAGIAPTVPGVRGPRL